MSQVNYAAMSDQELRQYFLLHREDIFLRDAEMIQTAITFSQYSILNLQCVAHQPK